MLSSSSPRLRSRSFILSLLLILLLAALLPTAATPAVATEELAGAAAPAQIGLQVGHWRSGELPDELSRLRTATGGSSGGMREVDLNLAVAQQTAERLRARGHAVDLLPATVPPGYRADLFLAIHADATTSPTPRGFKLARGRRSQIPTTDDRLVTIMREAYGRATGLPRSTAITRNMTGYYAFNSTRFRHAIHPATPSAILEMGYLTNPTDRALMTGQMDRVVEGIVDGLSDFLETLPPPGQREQPVPPRTLDCRRFAETNQEICGPFKRAWEVGGGLARFGLPISAEVEESDPATGKERTVQYFERVRFEHQPELAGTPGEIQLGLLGLTVTAGRKEAPFARIQPFADTEERRYFPESGHSLAGGFKHYWSAGGGLPAFGLPISEEFREVNTGDGRTYTVQYFERARFEYHPELAGTPYETSLGHLGRQVYAARGVQAPREEHTP